MVARRLPARLMLALSALAVVGLPAASAVQAAGSAWTVGAPSPRQPLFRPLGQEASSNGRVGHRQTLPSRRFGPQSANAIARSGEAPAFGQDRAGARKAVPVTRGQDLGLRFRPDERASPYGQIESPRQQAGAPGLDPALQSQFRPTQPRRKRTYEELQAERAQQELPPAGPLMPYPALPAPPLPPYGTPLPVW